MRGALLLVLMLASVPACSTAIDVPDGVFACDTAADCPEAFECRMDGLCYALPDGAAVDGGEDGSVDAALDAVVDGAMDGGG